MAYNFPKRGRLSFLKKEVKVLIIKDKLIHDDKIKSNEFMVYLGLLMLLRKNESLYYVNVKQIGYLLTKKYPTNSNLDRNVLSGIKGLISAKIISDENQAQDIKEEWILNLSNLMQSSQNKDKEEIKLSRDFYTFVDDKEIHKILNLNNKYFTKSINLLRFYLYVLSTIFKSGKHKGVGFTSLSNMVEDTGIGSKTISSYLAILMENELLYIYKSKDFIKFDTGEFIEISHTYGRFKDKNLINEIGSIHENEYGNKLNSKHKKVKKPTNKVRSYVQKYAYIKKSIEETGVIPYDDEDKIKDVYKFMKKLNKKQEGIKGKKTYPLDIFSSFDFYEDD